MAWSGCRTARSSREPNRAEAAGVAVLGAVVATGASSSSQPVIDSMAACGTSESCGRVIRNFCPGRWRDATWPPSAVRWLVIASAEATLPTSTTSVRRAGERVSASRLIDGRSASVWVVSRKPSASCPSVEAGPPEKLAGSSMVCIRWAFVTSLAKASPVSWAPHRTSASTPPIASAATAASVPPNFRPSSATRSTPARRLISSTARRMSSRQAARRPGSRSSPAESPVPSKSNRSVGRPAAASASARCRSVRWARIRSSPTGLHSTTPSARRLEPEGGW